MHLRLNIANTYKVILQSLIVYDVVCLFIFAFDMCVSAPMEMTQVNYRRALHGIDQKSI